MAGGYSILNALNKNTRQQAEEKPGGRFRTKDIAITDIYPNGNNFYAMQDVEALAEDIKAVGLLENLTVMYAPQDGKNYRLLGGERRWRALCMLAEQGLTEFATATCQIRKAENERAEIIEIIMCNRQRVKTVWEQIEEERRLKETLQEMRKNGETIKGYNLQEGRLRDTIAVILNYSAAKVGQMETIANNLLPELQDALREEKINFSAAYTIAKMDGQEQEAVLNAYQLAGTISSTQAREIAAGAKPEKRCENAAGTEKKAAEKQREEEGQEEETLPGQRSIDDYPEYLLELEAEEEPESEREEQESESKELGNGSEKQESKADAKKTETECTDETKPKFAVRFLRDILWDHEQKLKQMEECNDVPDGKLPERMLQTQRAVVEGLRLLLEKTKEREAQ